MKVKADFDGAHFAERVKNRAEVPDAKEDEELRKFFREVHIGDVNVPAIIVDAFGRILAWHLPDVLSSARVV